MEVIVWFSWDAPYPGGRPSAYMSHLWPGVLPRGDLFTPADTLVTRVFPYLVYCCQDSLSLGS